MKIEIWHFPVDMLSAGLVEISLKTVLCVGNVLRGVSCFFSSIPPMTSYWVSALSDVTNVAMHPELKQVISLHTFDYYDTSGPNCFLCREDTRH